MIDHYFSMSELSEDENTALVPQAPQGTGASASAATVATNTVRYNSAIAGVTSDRSASTAASTSANASATATASATAADKESTGASTTSTVSANSAIASGTCATIASRANTVTNTGANAVFDTKQVPDQDNHTPSYHVACLLDDHWRKLPFDGSEWDRRRRSNTYKLVQIDGEVCENNKNHDQLH